MVRKRKTATKRSAVEKPAAKVQDLKPTSPAPLSVVRFVRYQVPDGLSIQKEILFGGHSYALKQGEHSLVDYAQLWGVGLELADQIALQGSESVGCEVYNRKV